MIKDDKRVRLFIGHYGSGKSEVSINYVTQLRKMVDGEVSFADLDIVNVYFRTREKKEQLRAMGINPIDSSIETDTLDLPAVSAQVMTPLHEKNVDYVLDVGGDNVGTRVVGRFAEHFVEGEYDMFCVVNANREQTQTAEDVIRFIKSMEQTSKLKVTGLINNTHLIRQTTVEDVLRGQKLVREVSNLTNIPIKYVSCLRSLVDSLPDDLEGDILPIDLYLREVWM
ncbi:ATP-binding protein [Intestinibacter sp.]|uniref:ATP-binding protein n=1 Tax=Intestinibacter sp. TaxID=1965304 RepID=UPI002A90BF75|nr:ATP-binding protein [Intestinibacter sp.]MDY5213584.1 ATP-binding protein [Intestinibacter sp.]